MLLKLLKYEFKSTYLKFLSAFGVYFVIAAALLIFSHKNAALSVGLITVGIIALWVMMVVNILQRYNGNLYGSEGYLMFTLPVQGEKLLLSKLISAVVWVIALSIVSAASVYIVALCYVNIPSISSIFNQMFSHLGNLTSYFFEAGVGVILTIVSVFLSITVSKLPIWRKIGVLMGLVTYFLIDFVHSLPSILLAGAVTENAMNRNAIFALIPISSKATSYIWAQVCYDAVLCVAIFYIIAYLMNKKTSLK